MTTTLDPEVLDPPDLWTLPPSVQDIALAYYRAGQRAGHDDGYQEGYQASEEHMAALQRQAVASARQAASHASYAELAELRGDHERAAQARARDQAMWATPTPATPTYRFQGDPESQQLKDRLDALPGMTGPVDLRPRATSPPTTQTRTPPPARARTL